MEGLTQEQHVKFYYSVCDIFTDISKEYSNQKLVRVVADAFDVSYTNIVIDYNDDITVNGICNDEKNRRRLLRIYNRFLRDRYNDSIAAVEGYCQKEELGEIISSENITKAFESLGVKTPDDSSSEDEAESSDDSWATNSSSE